MLLLLRRILTARALAAGIALVANAAAVYLLPGTEYATASVTIAVAAIASPLFYQPFSKYVLISGHWQEVESAFWAAQPLVVILLSIAACAWWAIGKNVTPGLAAAAVVFALSQGWKEFCGELARSRSDIAGMQRLYVMDAITTTCLTIAVLAFFHVAEAFLLCSAASSIVWSWKLMPRPPGARVRLAEFAAIYRYSYGVVGTGSLNASAIAIARSAVMHASPPGMSSAIQFVLDLLQKPTALIGSSAITAALPEARKHPMEKILPKLAVIMSAILPGLALMACLASLLPSEYLPGATRPGVHLLLACALFVWANRYKSSVMDLPMLASSRHVPKLVFGGILSLALMWPFAHLGLPPIKMLVAASVALVSGGAVSLLVSYRAGLVNGAGALQASAAPVLATIFAILMVH